MGGANYELSRQFFTPVASAFELVRPADQGQFTGCG